MLYKAVIWEFACVRPILNYIILYSIIIWLLLLKTHFATSVPEDIYYIVTISHKYEKGFLEHSANKHQLCVFVGVICVCGQNNVSSDGKTHNCCF